MKTITKLVLATFAVPSLISASVLADDVRTEVRQSNHGGSITILYRQAQSDQSSSVAVYAQGQGVGSAVSAADSVAPLHLCVRDNGHGASQFIYR